MTSRDDFIAQLIAALQENEALAGAAPRSAASVGPESGSFFSQSALEAPHGPSLARRAYDALQFDFPVLEDAQLAALADTYRAITERRVALSEARTFAVTRKLVENVEYLNDSMNKRKGTEGSALLAAAVLVLVPRFCVESPNDSVTKALLKELYPPTPRAPPATEAEQHARMEQYARNAHAEETTTDEQFSGGFVEVYAAEEDPDDLSLVYEGSVPTQHAPVAPVDERAPATSMDPPRRCEQLGFLASSTYSTCFSLVPSDKWVEWEIDDALCDLSRSLLETEDDLDVDAQRVFGLDGEWQRYLFVLRDQLLRFSDSSDACAGGLAKLKSLVAEPTVEATPSQSNDPFFSFAKPASSTKPRSKAATQRLRIVFRMFAELAVSKEFNSTMARKSQYALATTIQQLFPTILRELQGLSTQVSQPSFDADHSDFVIVLLQLLHFVVDAAGATAASHQATVDKLQDSGLLRLWLSFLPPVDTTPDWPWLAPLLRLLGESALWNAEFAAYVHRVPKVVKLVETAYQDKSRLSCEALLLLIAAHQQSISVAKIPSTALWQWFASEHIFPSTCGSFIESMETMSNALFLLDALAKAITTLRAPVANELRTSLQSIYSSRFTTAFQYPSFVVPAPVSDAVESSLNKDEPEPPPREDGRVEEEKREEEEERGRAEALQFLAFRNRLRQCAKTILLSRVAGFSSSSKLD